MIDVCINCLRRSFVDGMVKCTACGFWRHDDCGPCEACREEGSLGGDGVLSAVASVVRQDAPAQEQAATRPASARCGCDPLEAEHVCMDSKQYPDNGDVRYEWRCVTCGAEWSEEKSHWNLYRDDTDEAALALSRELSPECADEEAFA